MKKKDGSNLLVNNAKDAKLQGKYRLSLKFLTLALEENPGSKEIIDNLAFLHLLQGNFELGWELYSRLNTNNKLAREQLSLPVWDGSNLNAEKLIIWDNEGLGDEIMHMSLLPTVLKLVKNIII